MMPTTPRHKRLAVTDAHGNRASSTPPQGRVSTALLAPHAVSPGSRHSSPGTDRLWNGRHYADDIIPRRLTASPVARIKDRDKTRRRLAQYHSIDHAVNLLKNAKKIVILSGAGISTSLDIPDFRSDGGFYDRLSASIGVSEPEEFFSLDFFTKNSEAFWDNVKSLLPRHARNKAGEYQAVMDDPGKTSTKPSRPRYSKVHALLSLLQSQQKLLTNYTQNIDGLEFAAGVDPSHVIQCHGSWDSASCLTCSKQIPAKKYLPIVYAGNYPRCKCAGNDLSLPKRRTAGNKGSPKKKKKRKRAVFEGDSDHSSDDGTSTPKGLYKPDITFFGEGIPETFGTRLDQDKHKADLVLIIGTSLKVRPVKTMLVDFPPSVPQIWINRDRYSGINSDMPGVHVDIELLGECDVVVEELCRRAEFPLQDFEWPNSPARSKKQSTKPPALNSIPVRGRTEATNGDSNHANKTIVPHPLSPIPEQVSKSFRPLPSHVEASRQDPQSCVTVSGDCLPAIHVDPVSNNPISNTKESPNTVETLPNKPVPPAVTLSKSDSIPSQPQPQPHPPPSISTKTHTIRVTSDIDAPWRWRIARKQTSTSSAGTAIVTTSPNKAVKRAGKN